MTWFKVDDGFYDHPKIIQLPNAAIGLWVKCGSWCARHETDGVIPAAQVRRMKGTPAQVKALIESGLWSELVTDSGVSSYAFRNWLEYQPSSELREEERALWREKKRKSRQRKLDKLRKLENVPGGVPEMSPGETSGGVPEMSGTPRACIPSRPDHKEVGVGSNLQAARAGAENPSPDFDSAVAVSPRLAAGGVDAESRQQHGPKPAPQGPPPGATPDSWSTHDDPRCWEHRELPRDQVPSCGACGQVRRWFEQQSWAEVEKHRREVRECPMCDDRGLVEVYTPSGTPQVVQCDHKTIPEQPKDMPAFQVASSADARQAALRRFRKGTARPEAPF